MSLILPVAVPVFPRDPDMERRYWLALRLAQWNPARVEFAVKIALIDTPSRVRRVSDPETQGVLMKKIAKKLVATLRLAIRRRAQEDAELGKMFAETLQVFANTLKTSR